MWHLCIISLVAIAVSADSSAATRRLIEFGPSLSHGVLVNHTLGAVPDVPIDSTRWTVVVVHGINPFSPIAHFTMAERYAEAIGRRFGSSINVLGWDWNAATLASVRPSVNDQVAVHQGFALAAAIQRAGIDPATIHLIGQSSGCVVAAAAARLLSAWCGRQVACLTLLDPISTQHRLIFVELSAGSTCRIVEHYWAPGPSGFGREAPYPGVRNTAVSGPNGLFGLLRPLHTDHLFLVRWHILQLER